MRACVRIRCLGAFVILRRHEEKILAQDRDTIREFNTLLGDYEPEWYFWECIELGRKLILAGFVSMLTGTRCTKQTACSLAPGFPR